MTNFDIFCRIKKDLDLILRTLKIDVHRPEENTALVLLISLVGSSGRQSHVSWELFPFVPGFTNLRKIQRLSCLPPLWGHEGDKVM